MEMEIYRGNKYFHNAHISSQLTVDILKLNRELWLSNKTSWCL